MATSSSKTLDHWREVFRTAGESDVFHVIRQAIRIAASNHPDEFSSRRDKIVQMLLTALPRVEKADEGHRDAVKAMEEEKEEEKSGRGDPVESVGALLAVQTTPPFAEEEPPRASVPVAVVEEKAETKRQETWKIVSASANGSKIRLRRVIHDQTKPQTTVTEHQLPDESRNDQEGSHHPEPARNDQHQQEGSLRSNLLAAKRRLSEGCWSYRPYEPRPKKFCRRPLQFRISGARLR